MTAFASIRPAAMAGSFYPADAAGLQAMIRWCFDGVAGTDLPAPKALIAPHAGYVYSGPVAARAYARLLPGQDVIRRVILLCPNHSVPLNEMAIPAASAFHTPFGDVAVDALAVAAVRDLPGVVVSDAAHAGEHAIEVHLPFLQMTLSAFTILPVVVGAVPADRVRDLLDRLWGGPETLILISSDLSHYQARPSAHRLDAMTAAAIETGDVSRIRGAQACGHFPIAGFLQIARERGLVPTRLDLRNSGDIAGGDDRVVGYGAWAFGPSDQPQLGQPQRDALLALVRASIQLGLQRGEVLTPDLTRLPTELSTWRAAFVTLEKAGHLRGCIGSLAATRALATDVAANGWAAAFSDPRFPPVQPHELAGLSISVSVLTPSRPLTVTGEDDLLSRLKPGRDGVILADGRRRATFLPAVWDDLPEPRTFIRELKRKGGWPADGWPAGMTVETYASESFYADFGPTS